MSSSADTEPLAEGFTPATVEAWRALANAKAADPERKLTTLLEEGLETQWIYTAADALASDPGGLPGQAPFVRGTRPGEPWAIRQRTAHPDRAAANRELLEDLEGGATEVLLAIDPTGAAGVRVASVDDLDEVLNGVLLDLAPIALEGGRSGADQLLQLYRRRGHDPRELRGSLRLDPFGSPTLDMGETVGRVATVRSEFPRLQVLVADTAAYVEAGAGGMCELSLALATGTAYLRAADAAGIDPAELAAATEFTLSVGPDQFLEIARLRAFRRLWATVLEHCGVAPEARRSPLYVRTSRRMYSSLDPWVNLLRATTASFAAATGGADGITVLPFDEPYGTGIGRPGPLGRRIARNTQLLLAEESSLHRVGDPAGGSWYVESLTDQITQVVWADFRDIERDGGIEGLLSGGGLEARLKQLTQARQQEIATRRRTLTGVNAFPLLGDDGLERPHPDEGSGGPATSLVQQTSDGGFAMTLVRDAHRFEALRERAGRLDGARILLATTGPLAAHVNVAQWAKNFFEAGGVETVTSEPDADLAGLVAEHGVTVAAVCVGKGSEPDDAVAALKDAGVERLYAVGADIDGAERVKDGVDMVAVLSSLLDLFEATEEAHA